MKEHGILYTGAMVRAYLAGRKNQTRRLLYVPGKLNAKSQEYTTYPPPQCLPPPGKNWVLSHWDKAQVGDVLWGREAHYVVGEFNQVFYRADGSNSLGDGLQWTGKWKPGIHMFRKHSRIIQLLTSKRIERLQDISADDAYDEGAGEWAAENPPKGPDGQPDKYSNVVRAYRALWDSINGDTGPASWDSNPWVIVLGYPRYTP